MTKRISFFIIRMCGNVNFTLSLFLFIVMYMMWNSVAPTDVRFDPAPNFGLLVAILMVWQTIAPNLIMAGQNAQSAKTDHLIEKTEQLEEKILALEEQILETENRILIVLKSNRKLIETIINSLPKQ